MHLVESAALTCGAKIGKPYIYEAFFPLPFERYIVFAPQNKAPARDYSYWQDVLNAIYPRLEAKGIRIIQIGSKDNLNYNGVVNLSGKITLNQAAYAIKNAMLFFGPDGFEAQVASAANIPIVCLNSLISSGNTGPYFGDKTKQKLFDGCIRIGNQKASFNMNENPKSINFIKPEEITNAIFEFLDIDFRIPFETVHIGERYSHFVIQEQILDGSRPLFAPDGMVEIRADLGGDEQTLVNFLNYYKKAVIITKDPINLGLLKNFKPHIEGIVLELTKENVRVDFLKAVREIGIKIILLSKLSQEEINKLKIRYYEFGTINKSRQTAPDVINTLKKDISSLYYRSCKIVASKDKPHYSMAAQEQGIALENNFEYQKVIDTPTFWENLDFFTIVKLKQ